MKKTPAESPQDAFQRKLRAAVERSRPEYAQGHWSMWWNGQPNDDSPKGKPLYWVVYWDSELDDNNHRTYLVDQMHIREGEVTLLHLPGRHDSERVQQQRRVWPEDEHMENL